MALELGNSGSGRAAIVHFDKAKAFRAAGLAVHNDPDLIHRAIRLEELAKVLFCGAERQITNINVHGTFPMGESTNDRPSSEQYSEQYRGEAARQVTRSEERRGGKE